jgi:hypothetical protein
MQVRILLVGRIAIKTMEAASAKAHKNISCQNSQFVPSFLLTNYCWSKASLRFQKQLHSAALAL